MFINKGNDNLHYIFKTRYTYKNCEPTNVINNMTYMKRNKKF